MALSYPEACARLWWTTGLAILTAKKNTTISGISSLVTWPANKCRIFSCCQSIAATPGAAARVGCCARQTRGQFLLRCRAGPPARRSSGTTFRPKLPAPCLGADSGRYYWSKLFFSGSQAALPAGRFHDGFTPTIVRGNHQSCPSIRRWGKKGLVFSPVLPTYATRLI